VSWTRTTRFATFASGLFTPLPIVILRPPTVATRVTRQSATRPVERAQPIGTTPDDEATFSAAVVRRRVGVGLEPPPEPPVPPLPELPPVTVGTYVPVALWPYSSVSR
jgi:hypothetical protein